MVHTIAAAMRENFLGNSPDWYKSTIVGFLILNPILFVMNPFIAGWVLVLEFIFTLAMALKCYPLQPGGLLAVEAIVLGMASPEMVFHEAEMNFPVIMLLMFMVAGIYFLREMLLFTFTKILLGVRSKVLLSLMFSFAAAFLSAFLDALTVTAVIITVAVGFYSVYHKVASGKKFDHDHDATTDEQIVELHREDLEGFRAFLRSLMMHGAVGTALGGVTTLVGEPQNLLIAEVMDWEFAEFFLKMAHISMPVLVVGLITCAMLEVTGVFGYGTKLSPKVREVLEAFDDDMSAKRTKQETSTIIVQAIVAVILVITLATHMAEPGVVGLLVIVLATAFNGRGAAVHRAAGRVFRDRRGHSQPAPVLAGHPLGHDLRRQGAGSAVLYRQWCAVDDLGQRLRRDGLHRRGQPDVPGGRDHARAVRRACDCHQHGY
jgi:NhaB family Na+:H+ antiporter